MTGGHCPRQPLPVQAATSELRAVPRSRVSAPDSLPPWRPIDVRDSDFPSQTEQIPANTTVCDVPSRFPTRRFSEMSPFEIEGNSPRGGPIRESFERQRMSGWRTASCRQSVLSINAVATDYHSCNCQTRCCRRRQWLDTLRTMRNPTWLPRKSAGSQYRVADRQSPASCVQHPHRQMRSEPELDTKGSTATSAV